ncbi:hypothetical protein Tco_0177666, partial [Tanacetum coccineum]
MASLNRRSNHLYAIKECSSCGIISPSEYDHFCFKIEPELGNLTMDVVEDIFPTREPRVHVPNVMSRIFEASHARGICPLITRASQSSASFGNPDILILST